MDLVVLVDHVAPWLADEGWMTAFGRPEPWTDEDWGLVRSRRVHLVDGFEVEFGLTTPEWARPPLDPSTAAVVRDGLRAIDDPELLDAAARPAG